MSIKVQSFVWENSKAKGSALLLLLAIADHAHDDGDGAYPSVETLAAKCRQSERNTQRLLRELEAMGEIVIKDQAGPRGCNVYLIPMGGAIFAGVTTGAQGVTTGAKKVPQMSPEPSLTIKEPNTTVSNPETGAVKNETLSMPLTALDQWNAIPSASQTNESTPAHPTLAAELPEEVYLFDKINETRGLKGRTRAQRFATLDQKQKFRQCIAFYNGHSKEMVDLVMSNGRGDVTAVVNAIAWHMNKDSRHRLNTVNSPTGMGHLPLHEAAH